MTIVNTNTPTYSVIARKVTTLLAKDVFITIKTFMPGDPRPKGLVGFVDLQIEVATSSLGAVLFIVPHCPVYRTGDTVNVCLPKLESGHSLSMLDSYSDEKLQEAFRNECNLLIERYPELGLLLGHSSPVDKEAASCN
jgi:hypothetical protein